MRNKLIAITAATALSLSSLAATPAKADQNLNNFLIAAGAIMIVAGVTANHEPRPRHGVVVTRTRVVSPARHCYMHRHHIPHRHPHRHRPRHHHLGGC